jgi:ADP-L-glycero-D-manno-heptose 6-epimerase
MRTALYKSGMILVTGAAGFIGSNLVAALAAQGESGIVGCDRLGQDDKWRNIAKHEFADFIAPENLASYLAEHTDDIDVLYHMGAISSTMETDADLIMENNFRLSMFLWDWCTLYQVRFIYASSAATYGGSSENFDDDGSCEALAKLLPMNAYGWSKHVFDRRVARLVADGGGAPPQWVGLKFFNVYGPNEYHKGLQQSVVPQIFKQILESGEAKLFESHNPNYTDGGQLRDFIWVGDCVERMIWLSDNLDVSGLFNCGTGKARSFKDMAEAVFTALDKSPKIKYIPTPESIRDKYQYFTEANMDRLSVAGCTVATKSLEQGVRLYVQDFLLASDPYY